MLSTENPPPDTSDEISQLKSGCNNFISSDEKAYLDVDLFKSGLDDISQTLPKFSIRDYVFSTRGKDIKTHWPFSPKNLQLCLKNGMKDVLPPFETLESVRNPSSIVKRADENLSRSGVNLSGSSNRLLSVSSKNVSQKLALDTENIKPNSPDEDKEYYPSTTTSLSCSDVNSAPFRIKSPFSEPKKPDIAVQAANKVKSNISQNPVKKCRLIVKLGNNVAEHKSNEESSEPMASKVCPVCKTFTSSSNTTLNAHIDQCLSGESTVKWTANPKVIKHRIKPRKSRLMVDIYETALCCTLEDLDRRNGTNWASNLCFPAQDLELRDQEKNNNEIHLIFSEEKKEEGAVYIDSNGTKLRILSKFSDVKSNSNGEDDCGPTKLVKRDKESKIVPSKKKKHFVQRHKVLKYPPYEQRHCSPMPHCCPEVNSAQEIKFSPEETEKYDFAQPLKACDRQMKSDDSGTIKQWVSSKRTGHKKKKNPEHKSHHPNKIGKNLKIKSRPPSQDDNPLLATESHKRKENMPFSSDDEYMEEQQPCRTNRAGFYLLDSRDCDGDKKYDHMMLSNSNFKRLKEKGPAVPNGTGNHAVCRSNKKTRSVSSTVNVDSSFISSRPLSKPHIFSSGGKKLTLSKNPLSTRHASFSESKKCLGNTKCLDFKKSAIHMQNNPVETRDEINAARMEKDSGNLSIDSARVLKIRKKRWGFLNDTASKRLNASLEPGSHGVEQNIGSFVGDVIPAGTSYSIEVVKNQDEFVREPISKISSGEHLIANFEMLCVDKVGEDLVAEVNVNEGEGNYFVDVDPIPIPGPPGSFLPSPGRMGSEELQGNSSLTSCRIHSSEDERELIDMDSSDSPISGTSFISNSIAFQSHPVQHDISEERTNLVVESSIPIDQAVGADIGNPKADESRAKLVFSESSSPLTSTPVLRLMGKNLMVVNKEEYPSPQSGPAELSMANGFPNRPSFANDVTFSRGPLFDDSQRRMPLQHFDFASNFRTAPQLWTPHEARVVLSSKASGEGFRSSLDCHEYASGYAFTPKIRVDPPIRTANSCGGKRKEMIVIDDLPENGASNLGFKTRYAESMQVGSLGYDSRHVNPFLGYQTRCYPLCSGSQMSQHANTHTPPGNGMNGNSVNWNIHTPEVPSASTGHKRSSFYFSNGFSLPTNFT